MLAAVIAGGLGAAAGTQLARVMARSAGVDVADTFGRVVSQGIAEGVPRTLRGFAIAIAVGVALAIPVALVTRHVQRALAIGLFGIVFSPVVWLAVHVVSVRRHPWMSTALPMVPMLVGCAAYGALLGLVVPIRGIRRAAQRQ